MLVPLLPFDTPLVTMTGLLLHLRYERSGTMHGLFRVRGFTQDDAHIFCLPDQIAPEIKAVLDLTEEILSKFGFTQFEVRHQAAYSTLHST